MSLSVSAPGPSRPPADREWGSPAEVATWLGVNVKLVYKLCEDPSFPAIKVGGVVRVRWARLDRWLERQRQHPARLRTKPGLSRPLASRAAGPSSPGVPAPASTGCADLALTEPE